MERKDNRFQKARKVFNQHGEESVAAVAKHTGLSKSLIDDLESTLDKRRDVGYTKIAILAKYYGVSADYLLGLSDVQSADMDMQAACEYLRLSERAVNVILHHTRDSDPIIDVYDKKFASVGSDMLDIFLCGDHFDKLLSAVRNLCNESYGMENKLRAVEWALTFGRDRSREPISFDEKELRTKYLYSELRLSYLEAQEVFMAFVDELCNYKEAEEMASSAVCSYSRKVEEERKENEKQLREMYGDEDGFNKETDN